MRDYDGRYGATTGFWTTDAFVEAAYRSLTQRGGQAGSDGTAFMAGGAAVASDGGRLMATGAGMAAAVSWRRRAGQQPARPPPPGHAARRRRRST